MFDEDDETKITPFNFQTTKKSSNFKIKIGQKN
jgi:hypothetical protein